MWRGFKADWLAARAPFDLAALAADPIDLLQRWAVQQERDRPLVVVDLAAGTGAAARRLAGWLAGRTLRLYAVDLDPYLLRLASSALGGRIIPVRGDLLEPLESAGGPRDGTVDLVVGSALADVVPLERLAERLAALLRPGGLAHLTLTYDGETSFLPVGEPAIERRVLAAYHCHMDLPRAAEPSYGGASAGRRLPAALKVAGLELLAAAPSWWDTARAGDAHQRRALLEGMLRFVVESLLELGEPEPAAVERWRADRRALLAAGQLQLRVRHLDLLARRP